MRCSACEPLLDRYLEGTLSPQQMREIAAHLEACASCAALLDELKVVDGLLVTAPRPALPENFTFAVMAEVRAMPQPRAYRRSWWAAVALYLAAAWVMLAAWWWADPRGAFAAFTAVGGAFVGGAQHLTATLEGFSRGFGPLAPAVLAVAGIVITLDLVACAVLVAIHRHVRPQLVSLLARTSSEAP
jgi:anti-sigma factor RsiW